MADIQANLRSETVEQVPSSPPCCVAKCTSLRDVFALLKEHSHSGVLVCNDEGRLEGIFTERDALRMMHRRPDWKTPVEQFMTPNPTTLSPDSPISKALLKMAFGGYRRLPIVDEANRPLAVINVSGLLHYIDEHFPGEVYNLPPKQMGCTEDRDGA